MRPKERIDIFLNHVNWEILAEKWGIDVSLFNYILTKENKLRGTVIRFWKANPDQRFGQMLINLGLVPDDLKIWLDEESEILLDQGCDPREVMLWGSIYDKEGNLLEKYKYRLIKDLDTDHINNILKDVEEGKYTIPEDYMKCFKGELKIRETLANLE
jgi:hypothetical protein